MRAELNLDPLRERVSSMVKEFLPSIPARAGFIRILLSDALKTSIYS